MKMRTQRGHVDMTDIHRLMAVAILAATVLAVAIAYAVYRLTRPNAAKRLLVRVVTGAALVLYPVAFLLYLPFRQRDAAPIRADFSDGARRLVKWFRIGGF